MKKFIKNSIIAVCLLSFFACKKEETPKNIYPAIIGGWKFETFHLNGEEVKNVESLDLKYHITPDSIWADPTYKRRYAFVAPCFLNVEDGTVIVAKFLDKEGKKLSLKSSGDSFTLTR